LFGDTTFRATQSDIIVFLNTIFRLSK